MLVACTFLFGHHPVTFYSLFQQANGSRRHGRLCKMVHFQLALLLLVTACPTSRTDSREEMISVLMRGSQVDHTHRLYWIQDPEDGLCLGEVGMTECSDANLWGVHASPKGAYSLELMASAPLDSNWTSAKPDMCLDRKRCRRASSDVTVGPCDHCGAKDWDLEADGRVTQDQGKNCLVRLDHRRLGFRHCKDQHTTFNYVEYRPFATSAGLQHHSAAGGTQHAQGKPMFKDPESGLHFPADLSGILGDSERNRRMVVMGGSALRFFGMSIYTVGLYINAEDAAKSPELQRFRGMEAAELRRNESFYAAMMSKTDQYDRAIWIKLSIPVKGSLVKKSLEADWNMDPVNKKILLDGSFRHAGSCCSRGTELFFMWTKEGTLEVRLDNQLVETFLSNDLAQDLFYNFVNDDPVSPHAKLAFVNRYPELLTKGISALELTAAAPSLRRTAPRYHSKEEPWHVKQHHSRRYLVTCMIILYSLAMVFSLPGSKRRFQERLRRGGGSWRAAALRGLAGSWNGYMQRLGGPLGSLIYKGLK